MNPLAHWVLPALLLFGWAVSAHGQDCKFSSDRSVDFAGPIKRVVISAAAGYLNIRGDAAENMNAKGRACASSESSLGKIALESRRDGDVIYLTATMPKGMFGGNKDSSLDLDITVPRTAQLNVTDTDGDLKVTDVGPTSIVDGDGDLQLKSIGGDLRVEDGAGDITIEDVQGNVQIVSDRAGDIAIVKVSGVEVLDDGVGSIAIRNVKRDVIIDRDSSGDIHVTEVGGRFTVRSHGRGEILHDHVRGDVQIPAG